MDTSGRSAVTPEAVRLRLDVAEVGSRMIALLIDHAIQLGVIIGLVLILNPIFGGFSDLSEVAVIVMMTGIFVIVWGYFPIFESVWRGQTPGKRAMKLRVISSNGSPATIPGILVRNLVRIVDFLPSAYAFGVISMLVSKRAQRLGDLAGGTIVVREARAPAARSADLPPAGPGQLQVDAGGLTAREDALVHGFLARRTSMDAPARAALAATVAGAIRARTNSERQPGESDEDFIEAVARALRAP